MIIHGRKFLVYGMGKTGVSLAKFIIKNGGKVAFFDKKNKILPKEIANIGVENHCETNKKQLLENVDCVILSPGVSVFDEVVKLAISKKTPVLSEMDFSFNFLSGTKIGITASCGKSTVTKMIYEMLKEDFPDVRIGGNYGVPFCELCENSTPQTISVLEVSSFMLEQSKSFHFDIAVFANVYKNHLDRHKTMKKYISAKCKIAKNMQYPDVVILPCGDSAIKGEVLKNANSVRPPKVVEFQRQNKVLPNYKTKNQLCEIKDNNIFIGEKQLIRTDEFTVKGLHNKENLLVASIVAEKMGASEKSIAKVAKNFQPLPHRFEKIAEKNGVAYINDSKSTSGKSAEISLTLVDCPAVLLVGGSDKSDDFLPFFKAIKSQPLILKTVIFGSAVRKLEYSAKTAGYFNYEKCESFNLAFEKGNSMCVAGSALILIPACPSYDEFDNFEKRGEHFAKLISGVEDGK
ncbi:MAG: UDP-N-acetylmuramoyl-L-alanine--D-glutamate ligase [Bacillota bacterium]